MSDNMYLLLIVMILLCPCKALGFDDCIERGDNCGAAEPVNCTKDYGELESYILNHDEIMDSLKEAFFRTGRDPSRFVRIRYVFLLTGNNTNDCSMANKTEEVYIWSDSPIYLLGPKPLLFLTLFAINIAEIGVRVPLPCLCYGQDDRLLSRLTYLIKVYPANQFTDGDSLQFINKYFFHAKGLDNDNYKSIVNIMRITIPFTLTLATVFIALSNKYVYPKLYSYTKRLHNMQHSDEEFFKSKAHLPAHLFTSLFLNFGLLSFHVVSVVNNIRYGNEVLDNENYDVESTTYEDHQAITIFHAAWSFIPIAGLFVTGITYVVFKCYYKNDNLMVLTASVSMTGTIVYLGSYFMPYMLLAFIYDPLQTAFIYLTLIAFGLCIYFYSFGFFQLKMATMYAGSRKWRDAGENMKNLAMAWGSSATITYFLGVIIYILDLGNFHDFMSAQNLLLPLMVGLFTYLVLKPANKAVEQMNINNGAINATIDTQVLMESQLY